MKRTKMSKTGKKSARGRIGSARDDQQSAYWARQARIAWAWAVHLICEGRCAVCEITWKLERHHIIPKARRFVRWHPMNGILLCDTHHRDNGRMSAHGRIEWMREFMEEHQPERMVWRDRMKRDMDDATILQGYDYRAQCELSHEITSGNHDFEWLCEHLGVA